MNMKAETENIKSSIPRQFRLRIQQWKNRIGLCLAVTTYFVTRKIYTKFCSCKRLNHDNT
jgi:hypothetical protein